MDKVFEFFGANGYQTTMVGGILLLFFYLRSQEAGVRNDINLSMQRLQKDKEALQAEIDKLELELVKKEAVIDLLRVERRAAEDHAASETRRADMAEYRLEARDQH